MSSLASDIMTACVRLLVFSKTLSKTDVPTPRYNTAERIEDLSLRSVILEASVPKLHQSAVSGLTGASLWPILRPENLLVIGIATGCSSEAAELWSSTLLHSTTPQPQNCILLRFLPRKFSGLKIGHSDAPVRPETAL